MGNVVFLLGDGRWGPCAQLTFQKYHLLYRPTACTSWKVLDLDDKDNQTFKPCILISGLVQSHSYILYI